MTSRKSRSCSAVHVRFLPPFVDDSGGGVAESAGLRTIRFQRIASFKAACRIE